MVRDEGIPVGWVTFRVKAREIMSTPLRVIQSYSTIPDTIRIMTKYNIKKLPELEF